MLTEKKVKYMHDFKKAFDSIWHQGLFYKLIESGIGGKTCDLIKSMYTESKCGVKINTKRTRYLSQERGVRQGCCLSPTLFNIYINDLRSVWSDLQPLASLYTTHRSDDLVLLSPTQHGLQQNLDLLEQYCQTWALTVNLKKTNIMIFQKRWNKNTALIEPVLLKCLWFLLRVAQRHFPLLKNSLQLKYSKLAVWVSAL